MGVVHHLPLTVCGLAFVLPALASRRIAAEPNHLSAGKMTPLAAVSGWPLSITLSDFVQHLLQEFFVLVLFKSFIYFMSDKKQHKEGKDVTFQFK
jgi:hypothetical protein